MYIMNSTDFNPYRPSFRQTFQDSNAEFVLARDCASLLDGYDYDECRQLLAHPSSSAAIVEQAIHVLSPKFEVFGEITDNDAAVMRTIWHAAQQLNIEYRKEIIPGNFWEFETKNDRLEVPFYGSGQGVPVECYSPDNCEEGCCPS